VTADRRDQFAEVLMQELDNIGAFDHSNDEPRDRVGIRLAADRMIRQAQAEALESAAEAAGSDKWRLGLWLHERAAELRGQQ
jgi:hypothetical protein